MVAGFNLETKDQQRVPNIVGGNLEIAPDQFVPNFIGTTFDNLIDLVVYCVDLNDDIITNPTFTVTNSAVNDSVNTTEVLTLSVGASDTLDISAVAPGYQSNNLSVSFTEGVPQRLFIVLSEIPKVLFTCDTTFKNSEGTTVARPLSSGYVEVKFNTSEAVDPNNYTVSFEAMQIGSSKYSSIVLGYELTSFDASGLTYKVDVVTNSGDYCYLSNIIKKQC